MFDNAKQLLTPGLALRVRVPIGKEHSAVLVSDRAIVTDQKQKYVLRVNEENKVEFLPVTLGAKHDGLRIIKEGLSANDRIIVEGTQRARRGQPVTPMEAKAATAASAVAAVTGHSLPAAD